MYLALSVSNDNYNSINHVCASVGMSTENDNFPGEGGGCVYAMILFETFYVLVCHR